MGKENLKGYAFAAIAAAAYGTNPAFAVPLYAQGMNPNTVLLFRYLLGLPLLLVMMKWFGTGLRVRAREVLPLVVAGVLMALSSLTLFESYRYMNVGVASTLLFVYPVMVALLMIAFFRERFSITVGVCLLLMGAGLFLLMKPGEGAQVSVRGCVLVLISALTYAVYIIIVKEWEPLRSLPAMRLLFYVILSGSMVFFVNMLIGTPVTLPAYGWGWANLMALAMVPTVLSLGLTTRAIQLIGPTPTAILGALEPLSAVLLGVVVLGQGLSGREMAGGVLILLATILVVLGSDSKKERKGDV